MFTRQIKIPAAEELKDKMPLSAAAKAVKAERDSEIAAVLRGESDKLLVISGPCSAHAEKPVLAYIERLSALSLKVKEKLVIVPRVYTSKPRTLGIGYKGLLTRPDFSGEDNILRGITLARRINLRAVEEFGLSGADELMYPEAYAYFDDLLSYVTIGARSAEDQLHRMTASGIDGAVGIKNPTDGSLSVLLNSIYAAQSAQTLLLGGWQVNTDGNPLSHAVLRGATLARGESVPNYGAESVKRLLRGYEERALKNPAVIIDTNHANSGKRYKMQVDVCRQVLGERADGAVKAGVKGFMIESFIEEGSQQSDVVFGKSVTDPCLGWSDTERLILEIAERA